ncbi:probable indole-3-pyruvate monooxygenase YUCCA10 [Elaeis guineensis]|uniref:indole-3-pyruvate monooxygenase n=1 Tax=Elaeis guineensis var. tenera TaxID=51953 RepID=A0A6I9R7G9_ELAGV|nr:probable indole-3-pyruvate monooxygenase YUCCA10 [Elaeis guineensis]
MEEVVVIVGAGPSGLAVAACLTSHCIPNIILERDDCIASIWRKRCYNRVTLHLGKQYCELPHAKHPPATPTFIPKDEFIRYLDDYASRFQLRVLLRRNVESAEFDAAAGRWRVAARNLDSSVAEEYLARYLVVASGENDCMVVPEIPGLDGFDGPVLHSCRYRSGSDFKGKNVLVVGCGNSGTEIAFDLADSGAKTSIVVRNQVHLVTKEIWLFGMFIMKFLPLHWVDMIVLFLCYIVFGNTSKYGIHRPTKGPMYLKANSPIYPVVDVGAFKKIKSGEIQVLPSIANIKGNSVTLSDGKQYHFDAIILATGYRSAIKTWLKSDDYLIGDDGMAKQKFPDHWKGRNGLYCAGLLRRGIYGSAEDAFSIANDISKSYQIDQGQTLEKVPKPAKV